MALPTPSTPGYGTFRGRTACTCLIAWLPAFEAELQRRGLLTGDLPIFQLTGDASASGNTHSQGGAFDITDLAGEIDLVVARQMGADATWSRDVGFSVKHVHGVLRGCPHNGPARYQIDAVDDDFNGLGADGRGGPDDGPRPLSHRTWREGIAWAIEQEENDMDDATIEKIAKRSAELVLAAKPKGSDLDVGQLLKRGANAVDRVKELAAKLGKPLS